MVELTFDDFSVGDKVRQYDWLLRPTGYRDGVVKEILDKAEGTKHGWLWVEFPKHGAPGTFCVRISSSQLTKEPSHD